MAQNIGQRLERLRSRRQGTDRTTVLSEDARRAVFASALNRETWQDRATGQHTRWVLGAMQAVDPDYTRVSMETGNRVANQLRTRLEANGRRPEFRLQGSVPLDIHIRGVSDVDLLALDSYLTFDPRGGLALVNGYGPASVPTSINVLSALRQESEEALRAAFPAAKVDTAGSKAIKIHGGSLARPVDVVPSHWHDTIDYQRSREDADRAVTILDKSAPRTLDNMPFKHIQLIKARCHGTGGSLRKSIRLCKNVKAELEADGRAVSLSSFDIASIMYDADGAALARGQHFELAILAETQRHLDYLWNNKDHARQLWVPDGTRRIFDSEEKFDGLLALSTELDDLTREVWKEQNPYANTASGMLPSYRSSLSQVTIR